jgi:hypothetical protein
VYKSPLSRSGSGPCSRKTSADFFLVTHLADSFARFALLH